MRLNMRLTPNEEAIPFDHVHNLTGALHKWLGENDLHDKISLYSIGWFDGGTARDGSLHFPEGATWRISFWEEKYTEDLVEGILDDPDVFSGMNVYEVHEQEPPNFGERYRFIVDSPVLVRKNRDDGTREHLLWKNEEADRILTRILRRKIHEADLSLDEMTGSAGAPTGEKKKDSKQPTVRFDRDYDGAKSKLVTIKDTSHRASVCPVIVEGPEEAVRFAWCVGVGDLTGSGFGALK